MAELFSNLGIDVKLLVAQAVNFLLVLWLLNRFVFKRILRFLDERKQGIAEGLELTEKAKHEMERIGEARTRALGKAREEAQVMLTEAKARGVAEERKMAAAAREQAEAVAQRAKQEAERRKQDAVRQAQQEVQNRAFFLAEKVLSRALTKEDEKRMEQDLVKELEGYGKKN